MEWRCCVCGEPLDSDNVSRCNLCGGYFHMAWSTKASVKECGHYRFIVCAVPARLKLVKAPKRARLGSFTNLFRTEPRAKTVA